MREETGKVEIQSSRHAPDYYRDVPARWKRKNQGIPAECVAGKKL